MLNNIKIDFGLLLGFISIIFWSTAATAFKIALVGLEVYEVLLISIITSIIIFLIFDVYELIRTKYKIKKEINNSPLQNSTQQNPTQIINSISPKRSILKINLIKYFTYLLNPFLYYIVLFEAYSLLTAQLALTLNYLWPIMLIIMMIITKREIFEKKLILSLTLSFLGFLVIISKGDMNNINIIFQSITNLTAINNSTSSYLFSKGVLFAIFSSVVWALYWLIKSSNNSHQINSNNIKSNEKLSVNFIFSFFALIIYLLFTDIELLDNLTTKVYNILNTSTKIYENSFWAAVYIGCFEMGVTFILWLKALNTTKKPIILANMVYLSPFLSIFWISLMLNEPIYITSIVGLILIILSIFIYNKKSKL